MANNPNPPAVRKNTMNPRLKRMPMGDESLPVAGLRIAPRLAPRWLSMTKPMASKIQNGKAASQPRNMPTIASLASSASSRGQSISSAAYCGASWGTTISPRQAPTA
ncbi:Uncharacterised protein [Bordetella pertussis]|nr:Uncharacterised protein [Bordetella pertussis]